MKKLNLIHTGAVSVTYNISVKSGLADTVLEDILRMDDKAVKKGGNPNFLTVTTKLSDRDILNIEGVEDAYQLKWEDLIRYIPSGSKVRTNISGKDMTVKVMWPFAAPPMTTKNVRNAELDLERSLINFVKDISKVMDISKSDLHPYTFLEGQKGEIIFIRELFLTVATKPEAKKFKDLDAALGKYK